MRALITGAGRGLGLAMARAALARGWAVEGTARGPVDLPGLRVHRLDVTDQAALDRLGQGMAPLDLLILNAGINPPDRQEVLDMDPALFAVVLRVNTIAPLMVTLACLPALRAARGRVLAISSQMSGMGSRRADQIAYRASKVALNKVMQGCATVLEPDGIPVALADPGWVRTDMGGPGADLDPVPVAEGLLDLGAGLTMAATGRFYRYTGEERSF